MEVVGRISTSSTFTPALATCQAASVPANPAPIINTEGGWLKKFNDVVEILILLGWNQFPLSFSGVAL